MRRAALALALVLAGGCGEPPSGDPGLALAVSVSPTPAVAGPARVLVSLSDRGAPVSGARVVLTGRPPEGGQPALDTAREQGPGSYAVAEFPLDAAGDWLLTARAYLPDGRRTEGAHPIHVVGRPPRR